TRGHAPGIRTRAQRLPPPAPAEGVRHNVPEDRTVQMHRQFGALDPRAVPRDRALAQARIRPPSTSEDSTRSDRREKVDLGRRSFAPIACLPPRIRERARSRTPPGSPAESGSPALPLAPGDEALRGWLPHADRP